MFQVPGLTPRLVRRIQSEFPEEEAALVMDALGEARLASTEPLGERVLAGIVLLSQGDLTRFEESLRLAQTDWRDLLVAAGLADEDWPVRLDSLLGPSDE